MENLLTTLAHLVKVHTCVRLKWIRSKRSIWVASETNYAQKLELHLGSQHSKTQAGDSKWHETPRHKQHKHIVNRKFFPITCLWALLQLSECVICYKIPSHCDKTSPTLLMTHPRGPPGLTNLFFEISSWSDIPHCPGTPSTWICSLAGGESQVWRTRQGISQM